MMKNIQARDQRCSCCNFATTSTSFSFVITYYIFQKQVKQQLATSFNNKDVQASHFSKNNEPVALFAR